MYYDIKREFCTKYGVLEEDVEYTLNHRENMGYLIFCMNPNMSVDEMKKDWKKLIQSSHGDSMNDELKLAHEFIKKQHETFLKSDKIKSQDERLRWSHAVQTIGNIAYNYDITPKK